MEHTGKLEGLPGAAFLVIGLAASRKGNADADIFVRHRPKGEVALEIVLAACLRVALVRRQKRGSPRRGKSDGGNRCKTDGGEQDGVER
jgi:hypothetical protein